MIRKSVIATDTIDLSLISCGIMVIIRTDRRQIMIRKTACLVAAALTLCALTSCNKDGDNKPTVETGDIVETGGPDATEPDQISASDPNVTETSAPEAVDSRIMNAFCDYAETHFAGDVEMLYKGVDYSDKGELYFGEDLILTPPERVAIYNYSIDTDSRKMVFEAQVFEYKSIYEACGVFGGLEESLTAKIVEKTGNNDFEMSLLGADSYYFNGRNDGFILSAIKGREMTAGFLTDKLDGFDLDKYSDILGYDLSQIDYTDTTGCYLKENCIILIYAQDLVLGSNATFDVDTNSLLKVCDALGIRNPLTAKTDFDTGYALCDKYGKLTVFFHDLAVALVNSEIDSLLNN